MKFSHFEPAENPDILKIYPQAGHYFVQYNEIGEGCGFFGTSPADKHYMFERRLIDGVMQQRECGYGEGCFFNDWGAL